jgi:hypothetical protein
MLGRHLRIYVSCSESSGGGDDGCYEHRSCATVATTATVQTSLTESTRHYENNRYF